MNRKRTTKNELSLPLSLSLFFLGFYQTRKVLCFSIVFIESNVFGTSMSEFNESAMISVLLDRDIQTIFNVLNFKNFILFVFSEEEFCSDTWSVSMSFSVN
jgi:hypothetical protein